MKTLKLLFAAALVAGSLVAPAAVAAKDGDVVRTGDCSGRADWKLKAGKRDGGIKVEFEVDSNRSGQVWRVTLYRNGNLFWSGYRTTLAPSGSFSVEKRTGDRSGTDYITARARHLSSGQTCVGKLSI